MGPSWWHSDNELGHVGKVLGSCPETSLSMRASDLDQPELGVGHGMRTLLKVPVSLALCLSLSHGRKKKRTMILLLLLLLNNLFQNTIIIVEKK